MSDQYIGEIRMFGGGFAPVHWALCNGTTLTVVDHSSLFSLIGVTYGGSGVTTFNLPDMRGRVPVHYGSGPGLTPRAIGSAYGVESVSLSINQIPSHSHPLRASTDHAFTNNPTGAVLATAVAPDAIYAPEVISTDLAALDDSAVSSAGSGVAHTNMMPYLGINFIICLQGTFPQRS